MGTEAGKGCGHSSRKPYLGTQSDVAEPGGAEATPAPPALLEEAGASPFYGPLWSVGSPSVSVSTLVLACCAPQPGRPWLIHTAGNHHIQGPDNVTVSSALTLLQVVPIL